MRAGGNHQQARKSVHRRGREEMPRRWRSFYRLRMVCLACGLIATRAGGQVTFERLLNSGKEPQNWLTYSGDYSGRRFSALDQVNVTNAHSLVAKWVYQTGAT